MKTLQLLITLFALAIAAWAAELPKTPAGKLTESFLEAIHKGTAAEQERFIQTHFSKTLRERHPAQKHRQIFTDLKKDLAGANLKEVKETDKAMKLVYEKPEETMTLEIKLTADQPPQIAGLGVQMTN